MREIKFRIWSEKYNRYFYNREDIEKLDGKVPYDYAIDSDEYYQAPLSYYLEVNGNSEFECGKSKYILEQFTGLYDKNGKEIYDGDIVAFENKYEWYRGSFPEWHTMTLEEKWAWLDKKPMFQYVIQYNAVEGYSSELSTQYIVIGNIHEVSNER